MQNQAKKTGELEKQIGQIMEFMAQIQEQSELSNSTIENLKEDFEIHDAITLGSAMEVGGEPKISKPSQNMDKQLLDRSIFMRLSWLVLVHLCRVSLVILMFKVIFVCFQTLSTKYARRCILEAFGACFELEMDSKCMGQVDGRI
ncbi:hypothetical protein ACFX2B_006923 [Malus domestica]